MFIYLIILLFLFILSCYIFNYTVSTTLLETFIEGAKGKKKGKKKSKKKGKKKKKKSKKKGKKKGKKKKKKSKRKSRKKKSKRKKRRKSRKKKSKRKKRRKSRKKKSKRKGPNPNAVDKLGGPEDQYSIQKWRVKCGQMTQLECKTEEKIGGSKRIPRCQALYNDLNVYESCDIAPTLLDNLNKLNSKSTSLSPASVTTQSVKQISSTPVSIQSAQEKSKDIMGVGGGGSVSSVSSGISSGISSMSNSISSMFSGFF